MITSRTTKKHSTTLAKHFSGTMDSSSEDPVADERSDGGKDLV
jgi:hypothetical protein